MTVYHPYDLTDKNLLSQRSKDLAEYLGVDSASIEMVKAELPAVRRVVDHAWREKCRPSNLVLIEFQSSFERAFSSG